MTSFTGMRDAQLVCIHMSDRETPIYLFIGCELKISQMEFLEPAHENLVQLYEWLSNFGPTLQHLVSRFRRPLNHVQAMKYSNSLQGLIFYSRCQMYPLTVQPYSHSPTNSCLRLWKQLHRHSRFYTQRYVHAGILRSQGEQSNSHKFPWVLTR